MSARRERGFALLIVLWSLVLIALVLSQLLASGRTATQLAMNMRSAAMSRAAADGAIAEAVFHLLGHGGVWAADGSEHDLAIGTAIVTVRVSSLGGKVNPNLASTALLAGLFQAAGLASRQAETLAEAVIAWRSPAATQQETDANRSAYRQAGLPYGPPGRSFSAVGELGNVIGMTPRLLMILAPQLSLYQSGDPNPALAAPLVRQALTLSGQAGAQTGVYEGNFLVVMIEAKARGPGQTMAQRRAIVRLAGDQAKVPYEILSLTDG
jgi:general secretion pathway protein K